MSLLDTLIYGYRTVLAAGVEITRRNQINFGAGLLAADNPTTGVTDVTALGVGGTGAVAMRTSAIATALVAGTDFHLTMTGAFAVTLPTAPAAGTSFEVKAVGVAPTLTRGGSDTIEGATTYVMVAGEAVLLRYNAASDNWELC